METMPGNTTEHVIGQFGRMKPEVLNRYVESGHLDQNRIDHSGYMAKHGTGQSEYIDQFGSIKFEIIDQPQRVSHGDIDQVRRDESGSQQFAYFQKDAVTFNCELQNNTQKLQNDNILLLEYALGFVSKVDDVSNDEIIGTSDEDSDVEESTFDKNNKEMGQSGSRQETIVVRDVNGFVGENVKIENVRCTPQSNEINNLEREFRPAVQANPSRGSLKKQKYKCSFCLKTFTGKSSLKHHLKKHKHPEKSTEMSCLIKESHKGISHKCEFCGECFSRKYTLTVHMKLHRQEGDDGTKRYISCDVCHKMFTTEINLALHMEIHTGTQKHACNTCEARFSRKTDLHRHETIHTGEKPYKCSLCGKCFRSPGDLGRHRKVHSGTQTCKYCGKTYVRLNEFQRHMAKHMTNGEASTEVNPDNRTYVCKICSDVFSSNLTLRNHMLTHERDCTKLPGHKKYTCDDCGLKFSTSSNRAKHKHRIHPTPESVLKCDMCSKVFNTAYDLKRHIRSTHLNQRLHQCAFCPSGYDKKKDFIRHMERIHPDEESFPQ